MVTWASLLLVSNCSLAFKSRWQFSCWHTWPLWNQMHHILPGRACDLGLVSHFTILPSLFSCVEGKGWGRTALLPYYETSFFAFVFYSFWHEASQLWFQSSVLLKCESGGLQGSSKHSGEEGQASQAPSALEPRAGSAHIFSARWGSIFLNKHLHFVCERDCTYKLIFPFFLNWAAKCYFVWGNLFLAALGGNIIRHSVTYIFENVGADSSILTKFCFNHSELSGNETPKGVEFGKCSLRTWH